MNEQIEQQNVTENTQTTSALMQENLPNSGLVLTLGIVSLVLTFCCCGPFTLPLSIITWVMGHKGTSTYNLNPTAYTRSSYGNMNAGKICGIVATVLGILAIVWIAFSISAMGGLDAYIEQVKRAAEQYQ